MADTTLSPSGLVQIEVGASEDTWGGKVNDNAALLNTLLTKVLQTQTYVPAVSFGTPGTSSFTYADQTGRYLQIGKLVVCEVGLTFTPALGTASGPFRVSLPVAASSIVGVTGGVPTVGSAFTWPSGSLGVGLSTTATARITITVTASGSSQMSPSNLTDGAAHILYFSLIYIAA